MKFKLSLSIIIIIVLIMLGVLGFFIYRGLQPEVFSLFAWGNMTPPSTLADAQSLLQTAISAGYLDSNCVMATTSDLTDAMQSGCSFCGLVWASDDSVNVYNVNQDSPTDCFQQVTSPQPLDPSNSGNIGVSVYGKKPSSSSTLAYNPSSNSASGIMPWIWGVNVNTKWSEYSPRLSI